MKPQDNNDKEIRMHLKSRVIRFLPLVLAIAAPALPARAEDWYLKTDVTDATKAAFTTAVSSLWTNKTGEAASKIETTDDCHVENGKKIITNVNLTFPGSKLHLGAVEGLTSGTITLRTSNLTANDLRWHSGTVNTGYAKRSPALAGNIYVDCEAKTHTIDASTGNVLIQMKAAFHGGSTAKVKVMGGQTLGPVRFSGDSSDYLGSFSLAEASTIFILANANTLGSSETARSDALSIDAANAVAAVQKGTIPNSARGIVINKSGFAFTAKVVSYDGGSDASRWSSDCSEYELPMPISGSYGFSKTGTGTVTLSGAYTAGAITVSAGTLHLAASSSFPVAQAITVKAGAQLVVHNKSLQSFSITAEEGAVVERVVDPIVSAYDPDAKTVTTVERTDLGLEDGEIQTLALSNKIALPSHDALELEVLRITAGSRDYTEADFEDATEKTYGLPRTGVSVVKSDDGVQHVYLNVRPVVTSVADIGNVGINGVASSWSDTAMPHEGADYLLKNYVGDVQKFGFRGDSLTIQTGVTLQFRASDASGNNHGLSMTNGSPVIVYPGVSTTEGFNGREFPCGGLIYLVGDYGDTGVFSYHLKYGETAGNQGRLRLDATLLGAGTIQFSGVANGTSWTGINGNNTNYFGRIIVSGNGTTVETKGTQCRVSKAEAFGGRLDEFQANAVTVYDYAMIKATGNVALTNDMNRGFRIANAGFNCDAGTTFETSWPIVLNGTLYKHGTGTLVLAGPMTHDTSSTKKLIVRAGTVSALSDEAVAGLTLTATNDFTVAVSPRSTAVNGFESVALTGDADPKINVAFDIASAEKGANYRLPICTVESDSGLTEDSFVVQKAKGYVCTLVSETVDETKTRWSLDCSKAGLVLIVQ